MKKIYQILFFTFLALKVVGQVPDNDNCANVQQLTDNQQITGTTVGAKPDVLPFFGETPYGGVWYKFTATSKSYLLDINSTDPNSNDPFDVFGIFNGDCSNLVFFTGQSHLNSHYFNSDNFVVGQDYYICLTGNNVPFNLKLTVLPSNNNCWNAEELVIDNEVLGTTVNALASTSNCTNYASPVVWYKFGATATEHTILVTSLTEEAIDVEILSGTICYNQTCVPNTQNLDNGVKTITLENLNIGDTYFVRVSNTDIQFKIKVTTPPLPPRCDNAISIQCGQIQTFNVTPSGQHAEIFCKDNPSIAYDSDLGAERVYKFTPSLSGDYYLELSAGDGNSVAYYLKPVSQSCDNKNWNCLGILSDANGSILELNGLSACTEYYLLLDASSSNVTSQAFKITSASSTNCSVLACPALTIPTNDVPLNSNISWTVVSGAVGYMLTIKMLEGINESIILNNVDVGNITSYQPSIPLSSNTTYYVSISPYTCNGEITTCDYMSFQTEVQLLPSCTTMTSPTPNSSGIGIFPIITWSAADRATGYKISIGTTSGGTEIVNNIDVGNQLNYQTDRIDHYNSLIFVKIIPYNSYGEAIGCPVQSYRVAPFVQCPDFMITWHNFQQVPVLPEIKWTPASGSPQGYKLLIGTTYHSGDILNIDVGNILSYTPSTPLPYQTVIYITLIPYNAASENQYCVSYLGVTEAAPSTCIFTGTVNNSWSIAENWSCGLVPRTVDSVIISDKTVLIDVPATCRGLRLEGTNAMLTPSVSTPNLLTVTNLDWRGGTIQNDIQVKNTIISTSTSKKLKQKTLFNNGTLSLTSPLILDGCNIENNGNFNISGGYLQGTIFDNNGITVSGGDKFENKGIFNIINFPFGNGEMPIFFNNYINGKLHFENQNILKFPFQAKFYEGSSITVSTTLLNNNSLPTIDFSNGGAWFENAYNIDNVNINFGNFNRLGFGGISGNPAAVLLFNQTMNFGTGNIQIPIVLKPTANLNIRGNAILLNSNIINQGKILSFESTGITLGNSVTIENKDGGEIIDPNLNSQQTNGNILTLINDGKITFSNPQAYHIRCASLTNNSIIDFKANGAIFLFENSIWGSTASFSVTSGLQPALFFDKTLELQGSLNAQKVMFTLNAETSVLTGTGSLTIGRFFQWLKGSVKCPIYINSDATANIMNTGSTLKLQSSFFNQGKTFSYAANVDFNNGHFENLNEFQLVNTKFLNETGSNAASNTFYNCGKMILFGGSTTPASEILIKFTGCPTSSINGTSTLNLVAPVKCDTCSPGSSPGILTLNPSVISTTSSVYNIEIIGGYGAEGIADDADQLVSTGNIDLTGTLLLKLDNPANGVYTIISSINGVISGNFSLIIYSLNGVSSTSPPAGVSIRINNKTVEVIIAPRLTAKIFLEGPFSTITNIDDKSFAGWMNDNLRKSKLVPINQPHTSALGYIHLGGSGNETIRSSLLDSVGNNAIIDWVYIQLLSSPTTVIATRSALLQRDGTIVDTNGVAPVAFNIQTDKNKFYVAIQHRNHIGVISKDSIASSLDLTLSTANNDINGIDKMKVITLSNGTQVCALWAGDIDNNGEIDATDRSQTWNDRNKTGYLNSDCNMDGETNASDRSATWNNRNKKN